MALLDEIKARKSEIISLGRSKGAYDIRLIGSVARGDDDEESDIDFLVNFEENRSLMDYMSFKHNLENLFQRKVDILCESALGSKFSQKISSDIKQL